MIQFVYENTKSAEDCNLIREPARNCFAAKCCSPQSQETLLFLEDVASGDSGEHLHLRTNDAILI